MSTVAELREEAKPLLVKADWQMRSCWKCNGAHEHLKSEDVGLVMCFVCGHWYFKGVDLTEEPSDSGGSK